MTPDPTSHDLHPNRRHNRRVAEVGLVGAVGLAAVLAVPALASVTSDSPEPAPTAAPEVEAPAGPTPEEQALASLAAATPEQLAGLTWLSLSAEQQAFVAFTSLTDDQRNFLVFASATDEERAALAAALAPKPRVSGGGGGGGGNPPNAYLACVRQRESGGNYQISSSNGLWHGAYQFTQQTWNATAQRAGRGDLVGVHPAQAAPADQDAMALVLYQWHGGRPWAGGSHPC